MYQYFAHVLCFLCEVSNNSSRCREVVQQSTTFDYMDFQAVHQWTVWRFSVRRQRQDFSDFSERAILASWRLSVFGLLDLVIFLF